MDSIRLKDGRRLAYREYGDPDGPPVLFVHGFGDSSVLRYHDDAYTASLGARIIAADFPGIGLSSHQRRRTVIGWASDAVQLVDHLGLGQFGLAAVSSGASHAMALAFSQPERVTRLSLASPTARFDGPEIWDYILADELRAIVRLHRLGMLFLLRPVYAWLSYKAHRNPKKFVTETAFNYSGDAECIMDSPAQYQIFEENFLTGISNLGAGMYEVTRSVMRPWGFEISDIHQPVTIFYGDMADLISCDISLQLAEQLKDCKTCLWPKSGRYGHVRKDRWAQFIRAAMPPTE